MVADSARCLKKNLLVVVDVVYLTSIDPLRMDRRNEFPP